MHILIADSFPAAHLEQLAIAGHRVDYQPSLTAETLPEHVAGPEALIVRSTKVSAATIVASDALSLIIRAGAGTNTIDTDTAAARGIYVCNVPGKNSIAVAELTMGLMMALDRNIPDNVAALRAGQWDKKRFSEAHGLYGKTVGILGLGSIGLEVATRASAFGMRVVGVRDPGRPPERVKAAENAGVEWVAGQDELLATSDIITIHVPLNDETRRLVDGAFLAKCRDGTWIINTSRGEVVDQPALLEALTQRGMRAGLDVFPDEPATGADEYDSELAAHPSVYGTHHIGASTAQAQLSIADAVLDILADYRRGVIHNCVNLETSPRGTCSISVRHLDRVGVLSAVLGVLKEEHINVGQMENRIFKGSTAAVANISVDRSIPTEVADRIAELDHVIGVRINHEEQQ